MRPDLTLMRRVPRLALTLLVATIVFAGADSASAQQKHKYFFKSPPGTTKFTQTHLMDVDDVAGHQVRMAEVTSKFGDEAPVYDGVKVREARGVLVSDYVAGTGNAFLHSVSTMENGDKVYSRYDIMAHTVIGPDGARRTSFTSVIRLTGGTGRFKGIRGTLRGFGFSDMKTGTSGSETEGEYWFEQ